MSRICKKHGSKGAFTLVELILVAAIILILAGALMVGVKDWIDLTNRANESVAEESNSISERIHDDEVTLSSYNF